MSIYTTHRPTDLLDAMRSVVVLLECRQRLRREQMVLDLAAAVRLRQGRSCIDLLRMRAQGQEQRKDCDERLLVQLGILERELGHGGLIRLLTAIEDSIAAEGASGSGSLGS